MRDDIEIQQALATWQLGAPRTPVSGRMGELLGRGAGSSLEFQEHRQYLPGDDIRHLDWAAYARSDHLMVRLYRDEISPRTQVLLDASRSMTVGDGKKKQVACQLALLLTRLAEQLGERPEVLPIDDTNPPRPLIGREIESLPLRKFESTTSLSERLASGRIPLRRQALRIVISDFLFPHDPAELIPRLAAEASALWIIQVLDGWEADPTAVGGRRLIDSETGGAVDLILNRTTIANYRQRLDRLQQELALAARRVHARCVPLIADHGLAAICREHLAPAELLRPR